MIAEAIACAVAYRIRGGLLTSIGIPSPRFINLSIWAATVTMVISRQAHNDSIAFVGLVFAMVVAGAPWDYFKGKFDLALPENRTLKNYAWLSLRGAVFMFPVAITCSLLGYHFAWQGVIAASLLPLWYIIGFWLPNRRPIISHSQIGEALMGASIGVALCL